MILLLYIFSDKRTNLLVTIAIFPAWKPVSLSQSKWVRKQGDLHLRVLLFPPDKTVLFIISWFRSIFVTARGGCLRVALTYFSVSF